MSSTSFEFEPLDAPVGLGEPEHVRVAQAQDILAQAHAEAEQIREAARGQGFQAGFEAGMQAAHEHMQPILATLEAAHVALGEERSRQADEVERHAIDLALMLASKTIGASLEVRPEHVVDVVRGGLRRLMERDRVLVLVNPDDMELVRSAVEDLKTELGGIGHLDVQSERRVARGGAMLKTEAGEIDGRLETQLERAREAMVEALQS